MKRILFFAFLSVLSFETPAQQSKIDSLLSVLTTAKEDTNKVKTLNDLSFRFDRNGDDGKALQYAGTALELAERINFKKGIADASYNIGHIYLNQGNFVSATNNYLKSLKIYEGLDDKMGVAKTYHGFGGVYGNQGNYSEALDNYLKASKKYEEIGFQKGVAFEYDEISQMYGDKGDYPKAMDYELKSLAIRKIIGRKRNIAVSLERIGNIYYYQKDYSNSADTLFSALKIFEEIGDSSGMASIYESIGSVYRQQNKYSESLKYNFDALKIFEKEGNDLESAKSYDNIGDINCQLNKFTDADKMLNKALSIYKQNRDNINIRDEYKSLADLYVKQKDYKKAYEYYQLFSSIKDTILNDENNKKTQKALMQYDFDKKEAKAKAEQDKKDAITSEQSRRERVIRYSVIGGLVMMFIIAAIIFRSLRVTRKQKQVIELKSKETEEQKKVIEEQKKLVEEKNKDITDSINYAKRIQRAMLPHRRDIWAAFPQSFVLFKPKDIVSGDFYFFHKSKDTFFIAAADCTGHGVPGAFMSMIGSDKLEDAVLQSTDTSTILSLLNKGVKTALKQSSESNESTRDGMDIVLCCIDTVNRIVKYAGANRPIWIIRKGATTVEEIKATKKAIGGFTEDNQHFDSHEIKLNEGDTFYLSTDGYADTFGKDGKKLMTKKFKDILLSIQDKTMKEQEKHLDEFVENWKSGTEQVDDILVIGVKL